VLLTVYCGLEALDALIQISENVPLLSSSGVRYLVLSAARLFSLKVIQQGRNMWEVFMNKDCIYFGALAGDYYYFVCRHILCYII
jgi:hypothetical protein